MNSRLLPFLALIFALALFFVYIDPTYTGSIATAQTAISDDQQALAAAATYTQKQNELAAARDAIDPTDLSRLETMLPDSVNNVQAILDLDALAARSGVILTAIGVNQGSDSSQSGNGLAGSNDPVGTVQLNISATGTYAAFRTFLAGIEGSLRLLDVSNLSIKSSATGVYSYSLTLQLYWLR